VANRLAASLKKSRPRFPKTAYLSFGSPSPSLLICVILTLGNLRPTRSDQ
jgi:hypothetical protein